MAANIIDFETLAKGRPQAVAPEPTHVGALAGLSERDRARAIEAYDTLMSPAAVRPDAVRKPPVRSLEEQLMLKTKGELLEYARSFGLSGLSKLKKAELSSLLAKITPEGVGLIKGILTMCPEYDFRAVRGAWENGGSSVYAREARITPCPIPLVSMLFDHDGSLHYVIADEVASALDEADWESIEHDRALRSSVYSCASACAEFYGVIEESELFDMILEWHADENEADVENAFEQAVATSLFLPDGFDVWLDDEEEAVYLTSGILSLNGDVFAVEDSPLEDEIELLEICRRAVRACQARYPRKPIPDEVRDDGLFAWASRMPCVLGLREFLDSHVPDSEDDYYFADDVLSQVIRVSAGSDLSKSGSIVDFLDEIGLLGNPETDAELIKLVSAVVDAAPRWFCNGWSLNEVRELGLGGAFYDERGRAVKVGRNDFCPCGSGKKYKKCCGR